MHNRNSLQNTKLTVGSFFRYKDKLPLSLSSSVVYKYTCGQCPATYIGLTKKQMKVRISQHRGISYRTNLPVTNVEYSKIYNHLVDSNHEIKEENFSILSQCNEIDLNILESIYINDKKPSLNDYSSSFNLCILK